MRATPTKCSNFVGFFLNQKLQKKFAHHDVMTKFFDDGRDGSNFIYLISHLIGNLPMNG